MVISSADTWTKTPGRTIVAVRSPDTNKLVAIKVARAAVEHVIETLGPQQAERMTLGEMISHLVTSPL